MQSGLRAKALPAAFQVVRGTPAVHQGRAVRVMEISSADQVQILVEGTPNACPPEEQIAVLNGMIRDAISAFGGKWKLEILWVLSHGTHRFNELRRAVPGVTQHMLTAQLRELEKDGLVRRTIYPEVPPRVEYDITEEARSLGPVFSAIFDWMRDRV